VYESLRDRPIAHRHFVRRVVGHLLVAGLLFAASLALGIWGYGHYEGLRWRDGFVNSAMLLGGMGPVNMPQTDGGKIFAGIYALFAGLLFIVVVGLVLGPPLHRLLHTLHWEEE
jgi:hypothetical protein